MTSPAQGPRTPPPPRITSRPRSPQERSICPPRTGPCPPTPQDRLPAPPQHRAGQRVQDRSFVLGSPTWGWGPPTVAPGAGDGPTAGLGVPGTRQRRQGLLPAVRPSRTPACGRVTHFVSPPGTRPPVAGGIAASPNASFPGGRGLRSVAGQWRARPRHAAAPVTLSQRAKVSGTASAFQVGAGGRGDERGRRGRKGWDAAGFHPGAPPADPSCGFGDGTGCREGAGGRFRRQRGEKDPVAGAG